MTEDITVKIEEVKLKIGIGLPIGRDINPEFLKMLFARFNDWTQKYIITIFTDTTIPIDLSRNNIVNIAKQNNCDYLFFIDSDVLIEEGYLERLLSHDRDIITGIYYQKAFPYYASIKKWLHKNTYYHIEPNGDDIIEIDGTGMGCFLIKMTIFDQIPYPWFEFKYYKNNRKWDQFSEDLYFCQKLRTMGAKIYCDPIVQCQHIGIPISIELAQKYKYARENALRDIGIFIKK